MKGALVYISGEDGDGAAPWDVMLLLHLVPFVMDNAGIWTVGWMG